MNSQNKPKVITAFEKLSEELQEQIKLENPDGFIDNLIKFNNKEGERISALRFETEEKIYLVKMSKIVAEQIIEEDEDYDDEGILTEDAKLEYEEKYEDDPDRYRSDEDE